MTDFNRVQTYILECIDLDILEIENLEAQNLDIENPRIKMTEMIKEFKRVAYYPYNFHIFRNDTKAIFRDYLQGLHSHLNFEVYYSEIRKVLTTVFDVKNVENLDDGACADLYHKRIFADFLDLVSQFGLSLCK
jgi:hypothetical protein